MFEKMQKLLPEPIGNKMTIDMPVMMVGMLLTLVEFFGLFVFTLLVLKRLSGRVFVIIDRPLWCYSFAIVLLFYVVNYIAMDNIVSRINYSREGIRAGVYSFDGFLSQYFVCGILLVPVYIVLGKMFNVKFKSAFVAITLFVVLYTCYLLVGWAALAVKILHYSNL